ncbi:hypothetical protein ACKFKG_05380 [Phormidesmis sp. 146-35]
MRPLRYLQSSALYHFSNRRSLDDFSDRALIVDRLMVCAIALLFFKMSIAQ